MSKELNTKRSSFSKMELFIKANGSENNAMATAHKFGQTVLNTRVTGKITKLMAKVNFGTLMVMSTKVNGRRTKLMVLEFTSM